VVINQAPIAHRFAHRKGNLLALVAGTVVHWLVPCKAARFIRVSTSSVDRKPCTGKAVSGVFSLTARQLDGVWLAHEMGQTYAVGSELAGRLA
jgi:hypothetical protein